LREKALAKKKQRTETTQPQSNNSSQQSSQQNHHHHHHQVPEPELVGGPLGEVVNKERQLTNRNTILLSKKEFTSILDMVNTVKHNDDKKRIEKSRLPERSNASDNKELDRRKYSNNHTDTQIIIVPAALTALLTMYNVKEFLEDGMYPFIIILLFYCCFHSQCTHHWKSITAQNVFPLKFHLDMIVDSYQVWIRKIQER